MKVDLSGRSARDYTLFVVDINVALRISDLLNLNWDNILNEKVKILNL